MSDWAAQQQRAVMRQKLFAAMAAAILLAAVYGVLALRSGRNSLPVAAERINPNTATAASLMRLPGIGRARALDIIKLRPYKSAAELERVRGIGPKTVEKIAPYLNFEQAEIRSQKSGVRSQKSGAQ